MNTNNQKEELKKQINSEYSAYLSNYRLEVLIAETEYNRRKLEHDKYLEGNVYDEDIIKNYHEFISKYWTNEKLRKEALSEKNFLRLKKLKELDNN
jgi:hypothetical protein